MISKDFMFQIAQRPFGNQAEISHEFLPFARVDPVSTPALTTFQGYGAGLAGGDSTLPKTIQTGSKNGPENTVAWDFFVGANKARAITLAEFARSSGHADSIGSVPIHQENVPFGGSLCGLTGETVLDLTSMPTNSSIEFRRK
jgi:hypothetical protein